MTDAGSWSTWWTILTIDFLRYALTAAGVWLVLCHLLAARLQRRRVLEEGPKPGQIAREFTWSMSTVLVFAATGFGIHSLQRAGMTQIYTDVAERGWPYWIFSLILIVVLHDAWFYWTHRLLHRPWWMRHVHQVHHRSASPTPWAAYSFHPVEAAIHAAFLPVFALTVPVHTATLFVFVIYMVVRNCVGHSGFEVLPWRLATRGWLRWHTTVSHHHFHHARGQGNFGLYFTWWDRLCGTESAAYLGNGDTRFAAGPTAAVASGASL